MLVGIGKFSVSIWNEVLNEVKEGVPEERGRIRESCI